MHPPIGLLKMTGYRRLIFHGGLGTLLFGVFNIFMGYVAMQDSLLIGGEIVLGLGALQVLMGLIGMFWDHPLSLVADGLTLLLLGGWHIYVLGIEASQGAQSSRATGWMLLFQFGGAVVLFSAAVAYTRLRSRHGVLTPDDYALCKKFLKEVEKRPKDDPECVPCTTRSWPNQINVVKILLGEQALFCVSAGWLGFNPMAEVVWTQSKDSVRALREHVSLFGKTVSLPAVKPGEKKRKLYLSKDALQRLRVWAAPEEGWDEEAAAQQQAVTRGLEHAQGALIWSILGIFLILPALIALPRGLYAQRLLRKQGQPSSGKATAAVLISLLVLLAVGGAVAYGVSQAR